MKLLVFFLEEPSAREMLKGLLLKILPADVYTQYVVFEGKQDLDKQLARKLRAWRIPNCRFVVVRDQDAADCRVVKSAIQKLCVDAGQSSVLIRIACHELESFYLGDLEAVGKALGISGISRQQNSRKYRVPDRLSGPANELMRLTKNEYDKVSGSRAIGPHLRIHRNKSNSFNQLVSGIKGLVANW